MSEAREGSILECEDCLAPADAFALVGNETRLSILEALWEADEHPTRFSTVRAAVGMSDSAQFNYHLSKLTDQFVRKTDEGYELRTAGRKVVQAVLAGSFNEHPRRELAIEDACTRCGATLTATYEDERLAIDCPSCGRRHGEYTFPPGGLHGRTDREILEAFDQRVRHLHCLAKDGVCPECNGRMHTVIERPDGDGDCCLDAGLRAEHVCEQCDHRLCSAVGLALLDQSDVVAFAREQGVRLSETPYWALEWCVSDDPATVVDENPLRLRVDVTVAGATLRVTLDGELSIVDTERR
jgi:hypothetical protein